MTADCEGQMSDVPNVTSYYALSLSINVINKLYYVGRPFFADAEWEMLHASGSSISQ